MYAGTTYTKRELHNYEPDLPETNNSPNENQDHDTAIVFDSNPKTVFDFNPKTKNELVYTLAANTSSAEFHAVATGSGSSHSDAL